MGLVNNDMEDGSIGEDVSDLIEKLLQNVKLEQMRANIELKGRLKLSQFYNKVQVLDEYCQGIMAILNNHSLEKYKYVWLVRLNNLVSKLLSYSKYFVTKFTLELKNDINNTAREIFGQIGAIFGKLIYECNEKLVLLLSNDVMNTILKSNTHQVLSHFTNIINELMQLMLIDKSDEMQYLDNSLILFDKIQQCLFKYYTANVEQSFELFVQFIKCSYLIGESKVLIPFLNNIANPKLGLLAINSSSIELINLLDYYKFMAFNLVALSLQAFESPDTNQTISHRKYNDEAEIYFRILLSFPNLATHIYANTQFGKPDDAEHEFLSRGKPENLIVPLPLRQEISWLYIINHLLRITTLQQLSEPNHYMQQEFDFVNKSLPASLSKDIHLSASRHGSTHASTVNISQLAQTSQTQNWKPIELMFLNKLRLRSLSSIFLDGTYKEKSKLIVNFLRLFNPKNTISIQDINDKFGNHNVDDIILRQSLGEEITGKRLYMNAINQICLILTGATIKFLFENTGLNNVSVLALTKITNCKSLIFDGLNKTQALEYKTDGTTVIFSTPTDVQFDIKEALAQQVQINKSVGDMDEMAARLQ